MSGVSGSLFRRRFGSIAAPGSQIVAVARYVFSKLCFIRRFFPHCLIKNWNLCIMLSILKSSLYTLGVLPIMKTRKPHLVHNVVAHVNR